MKKVTFMEFYRAITAVKFRFTSAYGSELEAIKHEFKPNRGK
jgi:hypothetical protein